MGILLTDNFITQVFHYIFKYSITTKSIKEDIMKTATEKRIQFREDLKSGKILITPGVGDALTAKVAEKSGISCVIMGGYSVSASRLGQPDVGLLSCTEMAEQLTGICNAVDIPVMADGDTGYGNALNMIRTERMFENAGSVCTFFEDQAWPKRCGHMEGKVVISAEEHAQKIRAAVDARLDKEMMIMSRTDARAVYGIDEAIERSKRYADAGAEMCFADGLCSREEVEKFALGMEGTGAYIVANMIEGGKTPIIPAEELQQMGYSVVFYACSAVYTITKALSGLFTALAKDGDTNAVADKLIPFGEFNHIIGQNFIIYFF